MGATTETYAYDNGDKLLSVSIGGSAVKTYGYDAAGRTTSVVSSAGTTTIAYDIESRATSISGPGISQTNTYNGLDTRVGSTTNSVTRTFLRDGAYVTDAVLKDGAATYTPGTSERRGSSTTYQHSGIKNADTQTSTSQAVTAARTYDAFGNVVSSTGTWSGPFGYAGGFGYQEDATGLKLLGHRLYDSSTGRFITRDPIKDGRNWYTYCGNDPISGVDPTGLLMGALYKYAIDAFLNSDWWSGADVEGPGGEPVRIGGWHAFFLNRDRNAMTVDGTVHINDFNDYEEYINDKPWSDHERHHIEQEDNYHGGNAVGFLFQIVVQYVFAGGHDGAPYEGEADAATTDPNRVHYPGGLWRVD